MKVAARPRSWISAVLSRLVSICCLSLFALDPLKVVPQDKGTKPPSLQDYRQFAMVHEGSVSEGKELFFNEQKSGCSRCHTVDGSAAKAGPDLFAIGDKLARQEIIQSIFFPSETIEGGYSTTTIETASGQDFSGIIKSATGSELELMGADGKRVRISKTAIQKQSTSDVSLMPEGLHAGMSLQEFADLIEYMVSLKQPESTRTAEHGMPRSIEALPTAVTLHPFHSEENRFEHPVWFGAMPGQTNAFLVVEHETGNIWRLDRNGPQESKTLFVNLEPVMKGTRGLLGMAFHPGFRDNGRYFYAKHVVEESQFHTYIMERIAAHDRKTDSGQPPRRILKFDNVTNVHYGGGLQFGPDGLLYIGMGDTGPQEDPHGHAQDTTLLLGKMLRIDPDHNSPGNSYSIPADNPFVRSSNMRPEIWAVGLREPWRFSFDAVTGDLWVGDVGQDRYEEVDLVKRGGNYGWNVYEGFESFSNRFRKSNESYITPVFAYGRKFGVSVTGGYVYRGERKSSFYGVYLFGDYQSRRIWGLTQEKGRLTKIRQIGLSPERIVSFACDEAGQLFLVGYEGTIYRIDFTGTVFD